MTDKMIAIKSSDRIETDFEKIAKEVEACLKCGVDEGYVISGIKNINSWKNKFYRELRKLNNGTKFTIRARQTEKTFILNVIRIK